MYTVPLVSRHYVSSSHILLYLLAVSLKGSTCTRRWRFTVCTNVNNQKFKPGLITWPTPIPALKGKEKSLKPQQLVVLSTGDSKCTIHSVPRKIPTGRKLGHRWT